MKLIPFLNELKEHKAVALALADLHTKLPQGLFYHLPSHTEDVMHEALLFGIEDGLSRRELELLVIAAAFHDTGYIDSRTENEPYGAERAKTTLQNSDEYTKDEIEQVVTMILDTRVSKDSGRPRQIPTTNLSRYLCDADMSNLGREDFLEKAKLLEKEKGGKEDLLSLEKLLKGHTWHCSAAKRLRGKGLEENLAAIQKKLGR